MDFPPVEPQREIKFPDNFRFGVADSDLQVIGEDSARAAEGSERTMWYRFAEERGIATPDVGVDRYNRWREDIGHLREMGIKHYRTSLSMSRTLHRDGTPNEAAIEWYATYFRALKEAGISIYGNLHHWELPLYLHERGGWLNRETASAFRRHTEVVVERLGEWIDEYFILNEPWCSSMLSYYLDIHAPGRQSATDKECLRDGVLAAHHLLLAQALAFGAIKERVPNAKVSTVYNVQTAYAYSSTPGDIEAARIGDGHFNTWFFDPIFTGRYPDYMVELYGEDSMPTDYERDMETIRIGPGLHALGINYYRGSLYHAGGGELKGEEVRLEGAPMNDLNWPLFTPPDYAEGLYDILQQVYYNYRTYGLKRLYVTENGIALNTPWDGSSDVVEDGKRIEYLTEHLRQLHKAILRGLPVEAYFTWTLIDNYEWAEGYRPESSFGLIHVERPSLRRVWKRSAHWYRDVIRTHTLPQQNLSR